MALVNTTYKILEDASEKCIKQKEYIQTLENNYEREKMAIDAKVNSTTQLKNNIVKNAKIENKISNTDNTIESKLNTYNDNIRLNEERRQRDIKLIKDNFQARVEALERRMMSDINEVDVRCDKYGAYLQTNREQLLAKKEFVIRDLSANIVVANIGEVFDEDAFPRLTKLKYDIQVEKERLVKLQKSKADAEKAYEDATRRYSQLQEESNRESQREEEYKAQLEKEKAIKQVRKEREAQNERERILQDNKRKALLEKQAQEAQANDWKQNVYKKLPEEYKKLIKLHDKASQDELIELDYNDVIKHVDSIKSKLLKLQELDVMYKKDDPYFNTKMWDMYGELTFKQQLQIAQMNKPAQIVHIKKYISEVAKEESSDDEEDEEEDEED